MISHLATLALSFMVFTASAQTPQATLHLYDQTCENQVLGVFTNKVDVSVYYGIYVPMPEGFYSLSVAGQVVYCAIFGNIDHTESPTSLPVHNIQSECIDIPFPGAPTGWSVYCVMPPER